MFSSTIRRFHTGKYALHKAVGHQNSQTVFLREWSTAAALEQDEELNWVKPRPHLGHVDPVLGITVPEIIRQNIGPWGNLIAFVRNIVVKILRIAD